ncbi:MAG: magnesium transporter CorA family protein [Actinomycetota bacterium]|nr:magnesium transporter CorA family protein [Actinomycetota bacterium]
MLMAVCHSAASGWTKVEDLDALSELRKEPGNLLWVEVDVKDLSRQDIGTIAEEFGLHPLAVEDAIRAKQRPKLDAYEGHMFLVFHELNEENGRDENGRDENGHIEASQIAIFAGDRWVITIHQSCTRILEEAKERWRDNEDRLRDEPPYLVHTLLDVAVDDYERIADGLEGRVEELEDVVLGSPLARVQRQLYSLKQQLSRLRRYALPLQRVLDSILNDEASKLLVGTSGDLFRDVQDHVIRLGDQIRNVDDLSDAVIDYMRAEQSTALNEVTKKLTGWAAIIAVPTFIASFYGMNFALIPNEGEIFGFWFALMMMAISGAFLYFYFKRKRWI